VFALVKVPDRAGVDLTKARFETTFTTQDGQAIGKRWTAAKGRKAGKVTAVFGLLPTVVGGEAKVIQDEE
jgi:hypothetical protein